jgi:citrate synthase
MNLHIAVPQSAHQQEDAVTTTVEATKPAAGKGGGLAGMVVADSRISFVDGSAGILEYRGYDIRILAENSTFEEVAYLLWNDHLPTAASWRR